MKLGEIYNTREVMNKLAVSDKMLASTAYKIAKNMMLHNEEMKLIEEQRVKLIKKYAEKKENGELVTKENGKEYVLSEENLQKLNNDMNDIFNEEVEIGFKKIKLKELENVGLKPIDILSLHFMIEYDEE